MRLDIPTTTEKPLVWLGSSYRDLMAMPGPVRQFFGHALGRAQQGERHESTKVLRGFGGAGILEIIRDDEMRRMKKEVIAGVEVLHGSDNVFADLGLPNAGKLKVKSDLVIEITRAIRRLGLTQEAAAQRMGLTQPKVSSIVRGDLANVSERKLMECLTRLGYDIEIAVRPSKRRTGQLTVAVA